MKKRYLIAGIIIIAISVYVNASTLCPFIQHHSHYHTGHAAETDKNGCHTGPTGFHCHN